MKKEHCSSADSLKEFTVAKWGLSTCPASEWKYVMNPRSLSQKWKGNGGRGRDYEYDYKRLMQALAELNWRLRERGLDELKEEEAIGARLLTGPMVVKYNLALYDTGRGARDARPVS